MSEDGEVSCLERVYLVRSSETTDGAQCTILLHSALVVAWVDIVQVMEQQHCPCMPARHLYSWIKDKIESRQQTDLLNANPIASSSQVGSGLKIQKERACSRHPSEILRAASRWT